MANIETLYDDRTHTLTYLVWDAETKDAVVIDPVLDYDPVTGRVWTESMDALSALIDDKDLKLRYVLETHAHADHLSSSQYLKRRYDARVAIGARISEVQETFAPVFDLGDDFKMDGSQFDLLLREGQKLEVGTMTVEVIETPGHTPACLTFKVDDALFVGDVIFMDDYGTGRCDFPKGSAEALFDSVTKLYAYPDDYRVFVGHDYQPGGRDLAYETTIGRSKVNNPQLRSETSKDDFVRMRNERDATLSAPKLLLPSVQVNIDAGQLPEAHENGKRYLSIPLNLPE